MADWDVAISALDTSTECDIQKALQNLIHGRSSLSITHRLSVSLFLYLKHSVWYASLIIDHCQCGSVSYLLTEFIDVSWFDVNHMILVFKDCQIIEQVSHKQLLELNGDFVGMWADQITAAGGLSVDEGLREPVSSYQKFDDTIPSSDKPVTMDIDTAPMQDTTEP